ncbi:MAG: ADP-ribosylglycohydrolase family protein, partial [Chthoniobacteraceae bacterium]
VVEGGSMSRIGQSQRKLGALWGALAGDALGVPVEFLSRETVRRNPVKDMRGFGTHNQPAGTWSDDSSLLLCAVESLAHYGGLNPTDLGQRFVRWKSAGHWTPHGRVFDIGIATSQALSRLAMGMAPEESGGSDEQSNGNGSLMRIVPVALWFDDLAPRDLAATAHRASALTHRHPRSQMACALYCLVVRELVAGAAAEDAFHNALKVFAELYAQPPFVAERSHFQLLEAGRLGGRSESEIDSTGYVMDTLTASIWCLLTSKSFEETVLKAVNLGGDTDTTGTVAGGLAGAFYGVEAIPTAWKEALARHDEIESLFTRFLSRHSASLVSLEPSKGSIKP